MSMRNVAVISLACVLGAYGTGCIELEGRPDAGIGDDPEGEISGLITVGDGSGTDPGFQGQAVLTSASGLRVVEDRRGELAPPPNKREWRRGDIWLSFPLGAYDIDTIGPVLNQMRVKARLADVKIEVDRCAVKRWCTAQVYGEDGELVSMNRTQEVAQRLNAQKPDDVIAVSVNHKMRGFRRPNDDFYNIQWHYQFLHMEPAWDLEVGSADLVMAVVDSGIVQG